MRSPRETFGAMLDRQMRLRLKPFEVSDWTASAVIFAPHPDDETLGCGGVAFKKMRSGAEVKFVFVTDGAASHHNHLAPETLRKVREAEAVEAVRRLGAPSAAATFLRFPDGAARHHIPAIAAAIEPLLATWRPRSVFVPHAKDPPTDHLAVNMSVHAALRGLGHPVTVFEYPVWYWYTWPWVRLRGDVPGMWRTTIRQTLRTMAGLRALTDLNTQAYVGDVIQEKRASLAAHASQTKRPTEQDDWLTLEDLSGGDFVRYLLSDYETFARYEMHW